MKFSCSYMYGGSNLLVPEYMNIHNTYNTHTLQVERGRRKKTCLEEEGEDTVALVLDSNYYFLLWWD